MRVQIIRVVESYGEKFEITEWEETKEVSHVSNWIIGLLPIGLLVITIANNI